MTTRAFFARGGVAFATLAVIALAACGASHPDAPLTSHGVCTGVRTPGLEISVFDSATNQPIATPPLVIATDGAFADTSHVFFASTSSLAYERAGTYAITVTHDGYRAWKRSGVVVTANECHVNSVRINALLQP